MTLASPWQPQYSSFCSTAWLLRSLGPGHSCLLFTSVATYTLLCSAMTISSPGGSLGQQTQDVQEMDSSPRMGNRRWFFHNSLLKQGRGFQGAADSTTIGGVPKKHFCPPLQAGPDTHRRLRSLALRWTPPKQAVDFVSLDYLSRDNSLCTRARAHTQSEKQACFLPVIKNERSLMSRLPS